MKKTKVENISTIQLDFFLKQNKKDIRVVLKPGESSWCDYETTTKSMILYERKNLIRSLNENIELPTIQTKGKDEKTIWKTEEISIKPLSEPIGQLVYIDFKLTPLETAKKETEEYKKESEKSYKGKKRGRKKKRGPKPGSKRKKGGDNISSENTD